MTPHIETISGALVNVFAPDPATICIEDIAHGLAMQCRFGGHVMDFYSVAQHSVIMSRMVPKPHALAGLLHDAAEAYLVDLPTPIKKRMPEFEMVEKRLLKVIFERFGVRWPMPPVIAEKDRYLMLHEAACLKPTSVSFEQPKGARVAFSQISSPTLAKKVFLNRFRELTGSVGNEGVKRAGGRLF